MTQIICESGILWRHVLKRFEDRVNKALKSAGVSTLADYNVSVHWFRMYCYTIIEVVPTKGVSDEV